ncbi:MAG: FHA domain-containing protein [Myxococcaceae bacterium]
MNLIVEDADGRRSVFPAAVAEITIGRDEDNTIQLADRNVSRRHARVVRVEGGLEIEDLSSANGILLNGERVSGRASLTSRDVVQIGDYSLALEEDAAAIWRQPSATCWLDVLERTRTRTQTELPGSEMPRLHFVLQGAPTTLECGGTEITVGRAPDNHIVLDEPSVSPVHAKIVRERGEWRVIDLRSEQGVRVNGHGYAHSPIRFGDVLTLGEVNIQFEAPGWEYEAPPPLAAKPRGDKKRYFALAGAAALLVAFGWAMLRHL